MRLFASLLLLLVTWTLPLTLSLLQDPTWHLLSIFRRIWPLFRSKHGVRMASRKGVRALAGSTCMQCPHMCERCRREIEEEGWRGRGEREWGQGRNASTRGGAPSALAESHSAVV
jgi:hypothetical protein